MPATTTIETDEIAFCDSCHHELTADEVYDLGDECLRCYYARHFDYARRFDCERCRELIDESCLPSHCESCATEIQKEKSR